MKVQMNWEMKDDLIKHIFLGAMSDALDHALRRRIHAANWPARHAQRMLWKKGIDPERVHACLRQLITDGDPDFYALQVEAFVQAATLIAVSRLEGTVQPSCEAFIEAFRPLFKAALVEQGFIHIIPLRAEVTIEEVMTTRGFPEEVAKIEDTLRRAWSATIERHQKFRVLADDIGYRRLERVERHRLKRLAEEEATRKARAEEEQKRNSEAARQERDRRKAEARAKGEQARERAKQRAEEKRAQWLADHPRKHA